MRSLFFLVCFFVFMPNAFSSKVALIIGNSDYRHESKLPNPVRDAKVVAELFKAAGFQHVIVEENVTKVGLSKSLYEFRKRSRGALISVVYYSGHGMEIDGENYLIPVDAELLKDDDVDYQAVSMDDALKATRGAKQLRLLILDACRNNPFSAKMERTAGLTKSVSKGLAPVEVSGNILVAYAAKGGTVAYDGKGNNSPYVRAIAQYLTKPGLDLRRAFGYVRDAVRKETSYKQTPWIYGSLGGDHISLARSGNITGTVPKDDLKPKGNKESLCHTANPPISCLWRSN